jgi:hypothetical protein
LSWAESCSVPRRALFVWERVRMACFSDMGAGQRVGLIVLRWESLSFLSIRGGKRG